MLCYYEERKLFVVFQLMYGTICEISGPSAFNGLSQLSKLIQGILDKTIRNTNERDNAKRDIATIVSNCLPVYLSGSNSDVYPLSALVSDLCSLALLEVEENGKKLNKSQTFRKTCSFELTISTLHRLCEKRLLHCCSDFLPFVSDILTKPFLHSQSWMEDEVTNILIKFVTLSISTIPQEQIRRLWSVVWSRFSHVIGNSGKSSGNYLRVTVAILGHIHRTDMTLGEYGEKLISDLIDNFFAALRRTDMKKWRMQIEYGLQLLVLLIDDWGIEFREKLLDHCLPLASSLVHDLDFSAASSISLNSTWPFFDRLFHLAVPDCKPSCLVRSETYYLAQSACEVIVNSLSSISSNRSDYELQNEYVPLLARLVIIADTNHSNELDHSVIAYTRNIKRRKTQKFLDVISDWSSVENTEYNEHRHLVVSWLFVGYEIASRWSHRIESDCLTSMAMKLWAGRDRIKVDWQFGPYCRLLNILLRKGALDTLCNEELETVRSLWKFALSSAHARFSFESASSLMISLLKRFPSVIGDESDITDVICDIFSRWSTPHGPVLYDLVATLLTEFEFDEFAPFPGVTDKKKGLKEWRFRCQIAEWLITYVEPQCSLEELLLLLCGFHPCRTSAVSSVPVSKVQIERDLISFGLCEKRILPSDDRPTIPFVVIPEMVDYISGVIKQFWIDRELKDEVRISLWCSYMNFLCKLGSEFYAKNTILLNAMNHWMSTFALEAKADILSQIRAQELSSELVPLDLLTVLATRLDDCPSLAVHLLIHEVQLQISSRNIYLDKTDSSKVRCAANRLLEEFTRDVDTVPDLLLLLDECGDIMESRSRIAIAYKVLDLIDDDVTTNEYDVAQACIYRKLLTTYVMRASKPGGCPSIDLKAVSAQCVVRYIDSLPSSVVNWEFVSNLLDRIGSNVIFTLKLVNRLLSDPTKFHVHPRILSAVLKNPKVLQACEQFIPNFALILDCHYNSLMLADSSHQQLPYLDVTSPLRNDFLVQCLGNGNIHLIKTGAFPAAFFINLDVCDRHAQLLITNFWRSFMDDPHEILTSLWKAVCMSINCNAHLLLLHNLLITARSPQRKTLSTCMQKGFDLAIYSIFSTMIRAAKIRHPDLVCYIYNQISASKCLSSEDILFLSCAGDNSDLEDREQISKIVNSAVDIFIECGYAKQHISAEDISQLPCYLFRDLVIMLRSSMSGADTLFLAVNECFCYVPKLCQVLAPYIPQLDISNYESVVVVLSRYASLVAETDLDATMQSTRRMARCIAECVDSFGLERLSSVKLGNLVCPDGLCALAKCCILADLPHYAFAVANMFYDIGINYSGSCRRVKYALAIRNMKWDEISYPKKLDSHEERLFSALYLTGRCERSANKILDFIQKTECENMRKDDLPKLVSLEHLRDLAVIRMSSALSNNEIMAMGDSRLFLLVAAKLRLTDRLDSSAAVFGQDLLISTVMTRLSNLKAFVPCFAILEKCAGNYSVLEKCRVHMLKGDYSTAEHLIRDLLDSS
ncbi:unnamed protein product [Angiostrongylus costaricensis]|uniref:DUF2428 domain-containing protein n=1 Tax=Angiostrongylus costaricensis TaxID=334426 RepID=A0A158PI65_ANGCS|nr:unnamed protein product [Angiostrongylus costaricensis]